MISTSLQKRRRDTRIAETPAMKHIRALGTGPFQKRKLSPTIRHSPPGPRMSPSSMRNAPQIIMEHDLYIYAEKKA
jgi:hypothetical protein